MSPFGKVVLLIAVVVLVVWLVTKFRDLGRQDTGRPVPVQELPQGVRESIDHQLAEGRRIRAIKIYRDATKASLPQAKQAIDARDWTSS
jgi:hypothetical protein